MNKKIIFLLISLLISCTNKKEQLFLYNDGNEEITKEIINYIGPYYYNGKVEITQTQLDAVDFSYPSSLIEISNRLTDHNRNNITLINIRNGERIISLEGIELFPALECLYIYNSNIKEINVVNEHHFVLRDLVIESKELMDVNDIVLFNNLESLYLLGSYKLVHFPDINHLINLSNIYLKNCININFNSLAEKLPLNLKILHLNYCNISSFNDISNLFTKNITHFDLSYNLIEEITLDIDFGSAIYFYMAKCPVEEKYFKWDEPTSDEFPGFLINDNGVLFKFGYMEDYAWVIKKE